MSKVILYNTNHVKTKVGRPHKIFVDQLKDDVDLDIGDMTNAMKDRDVWKIIVTIIYIYIYIYMFIIHI